VFLLTLAIVDDVGAIVVIALFYGQGFDPAGLLVAGLGITSIVLMQKLAVRSALLYFPPALVVWAGALRAGIHPTIAGVVVGLLTPVRVWLDEGRFLSLAQARLEDFRERARQPSHSEHDLVEPLHQLDKARREAISPVERLTTAFHPWVAYGVMPLFALANAGVSIAEVQSGETELRLAFGIALGLVLGKGAGVLLSCWLSVKTGLALLPRGVTTRGLLLVGGVAGIGFTMSLFIADLAFAGSALLPTAKLATLLSSGAAAVGSCIYGLIALRRADADDVRSVRR
jgi:NhaA family Na+:H+ antiporter